MPLFSLSVNKVSVHSLTCIDIENNTESDIYSISGCPMCSQHVFIVFIQPQRAADDVVLMSLEHSGKTVRKHLVYHLFCKMFLFEFICYTFNLYGTFKENFKKRRKDLGWTVWKTPFPSGSLHLPTALQRSDTEGKLVSSSLTNLPWNVVLSS